MKKLLLSILFSVLYVSSASADLGVNIGASANAGLFAASGSETAGTTGVANNGTEHGAGSWGEIFVEKTFGDMFIIGASYSPTALETDTAETAKTTTDPTNADSKSDVTNKIQIDFEDLTTYYIGARIGENFYAKLGTTHIQVITNESLETGSSYGNTDLDGAIFGLGYNRTNDNGTFFRFEGNYMNFDSTQLTSSANGNAVKLKNLDGVSGKLSIGKSF